MAGITGHPLLPPEIRFVQRVYHKNHLARSLFHRRVYGICFQALALWRMAINAVQACGGGKESHRIHKFFNGNPFEQLDVLENVFSHQWLLVRFLRYLGGGCLAVCKWCARKIRHYRPQNQMNHSFRSDIHFPLISLRSAQMWTRRSALPCRVTHFTPNQFGALGLCPKATHGTTDRTNRWGLSIRWVWDILSRVWAAPGMSGAMGKPSSEPGQACL